MMEPSRGKVITFYSYKGGTGRSMAVANIACLLSRRSDVTRGVLVIDWDLDAPGLHWFFSKHSSDNADKALSPSNDGVVEVFRSVRNRLHSFSLQPVSEDDADRTIREIDLSKFVLATDVPKVKLMPAGRFTGDYGGEVGLFDWRELFNIAPTAIRAFAERAAELYDYVLIDSRTGLNDISGICTTLLPDELVIVFTPNHQSLMGGIETARRAVNYRRESADIRPLTVYPLPSRVEMSEPELLEKWRFGDDLRQEDVQGYQKRFEKLFSEIYSLGACDLKSYFDEIQIQHVPRYSYGEDIAARHERGSRLSLSRSYATFADVLSSGDLPWNILPSMQRGAELVSDASPSAVKVQTVKEYLAEDRFRLKLHDLVATEVKGIVTEIARVPVQATPDIHAVADRLHTYEAISNDLVAMEGLLGYWGTTSHRKILTLGPKQVFDTATPISGLTAYIAARAYPALLLLYSGGIAAVAAAQFENLRDLMLFPVTDPYRDPEARVSFIMPLTKRILDLERLEVFRQLPGFERRHAAKSDYLYSILQPLVGDVLVLGSDYDRAFDRFELLYTLEYCNQTVRSDSDRFWGPIGRFGWKRTAVRDLIMEADQEKEGWGPIKAGLFDASFERFKFIIDGFSQLIDKLEWF